MKRILSLLCTSFLLLATLTGCGGANSSAGSTASGQTGQAATATKAPETSQAATRTVSTVMGDIEVPANPQRVVANWYAGDVITLGLNLVGYFAWEQETMPFYKELLASTKINKWEPEEVMALEPDLIVTYAKEDFNKFSKIAPVLVLPESGMTPLERIKIIGEATGRLAEAEAAVATFEAKLASAKKNLPGSAFEGKTFSITEDWGSGSYGVYYYDTGSRGGMLVYEYLGLAKPPKLEKLIADTGKGSDGLSYEVASDYFGDYMIWFRPFNAKEDVPSEYEKTEMWKTIPAVREGRVVFVPGKMSGLFYYSDVTSLTAQLDYIIDALNSLVR